MSDKTPEYDPDTARSREEIMEIITGLLTIMRNEVEFLEEIHTRLEEGEPMENVFNDFTEESQLDDIESYLNSF